jgi:hypothetical protein
MQPIDGELFKLLIPVSICHALGHVMTNVSFAAVAVSFTHTIKALEPFFNAAASQFILGQQIPVTLWLSLAPIVLGKFTSFTINSATQLSLFCQLCSLLCAQELLKIKDFCWWIFLGAVIPSML